MNFLDKVVEKYIAEFPNETERLRPLIKQLTNDSSMTDRKVMPGHVTASALVIEGENILMIFHPFLKKWLQPGGHIDTGESPWEAAQRELLEETGLSAELHPWHQINGIPFDMDIHLIPANAEKSESEHLHYDFRYLFCLDKTVAQKTEQDHLSKWMRLEEAAELQHLAEKIKFFWSSPK